MNTIPLPLPESAKRFWAHLVPVMLFPSFAAVLISRTQEKWAVLTMFLTFAAVSFYAMWPTLKGRAKYSFWLLACGLYMSGAMLAIPVLLIVQVIFGRPAQ